jgi:hypothetical protein
MAVPVDTTTSETQPSADSREFHPLTDRILSRLPVRRAVAILVWALVPWLNAGANLALGAEHASPVWEQSTTLIILSYISVSFAIVMSLWGTTRIAQGLEALRTPSRPLDGEASRLFRGINSRRGPLAASIGAAILFGVSTGIGEGWAAGLLRGATWLVVGIALFTFLWTYVSFLLALDRLGHQQLIPDTVHADPGLGLRPLGALAASGLWMLLAWLVPVLLTGLPDVVGAVSGMLVLLAVLAGFFLSLFRLHRQMIEVKADELALARELYAQAYEPVYRARNLEALEEQRALIGAADALEKRASGIHEWPFTERTPTVVITVATSVTAMTIGRLILDPFGL